MGGRLRTSLSRADANKIVPSEYNNFQSFMKSLNIVIGVVGGGGGVGGTIVHHEVESICRRAIE